jgi:hypothetical protein
VGDGSFGSHPNDLLPPPPVSSWDAPDFQYNASGIIPVHECQYLSGVGFATHISLHKQGRYPLKVYSVINGVFLRRFSTRLRQPDKKTVMPSALLVSISTLKDLPRTETNPCSRLIAMHLLPAPPP